MPCIDCKNKAQDVEFMGRKACLCVLSNRILKGDNECYLYNQDLSDFKICLNCKHFISNAGDWGLFCKLDYYKIGEAMEDACEKFEKK